MREERNGAKYTYSIKAPSGFNSKLEGRLRGPDHHCVVTAACEGEFIDDIFTLKAAKELLDACVGLVDLYVANKDTDREFLNCITPKHASEMTGEERRSCAVWSKFDAARSAIAKATNKQ